MARGIVKKADMGSLGDLLQQMNDRTADERWVYPQGSVTNAGYALTVGNTLPATSYTASAVLNK